MDDLTRKHLSLLKDEHRSLCFELGEHPGEFDTAYSTGANAIERVYALLEKFNIKGG